MSKGAPQQTAGKQIIGEECLSHKKNAFLKTIETVCKGIWRLKGSVVLRIEEDGAILFDPDTDSTVVINITGTSLLRWRPNRICFNEWCEAVSSHYENIEFARIRNDMKTFFAFISFFLEPCDGELNQSTLCTNQC